MRDIALDVHLDFCEVAIAEAGGVRSAIRLDRTSIARAVELAQCRRRAKRWKCATAGARHDVRRAARTAAYPQFMTVVYEYSDDDWRASADHRPLAGVDVNQVVLLHRHWIAANLQRARFNELLPDAKSPAEDEAFLASECFVAMYLWYALLWVVIEGFQDRRIDIRGAMRADIDAMAAHLRRCRNAIFHVPENNHDPRLFELMEKPDSAAVISRISTGFGRLFLEEVAARKQTGEIPS
jgi:hypothetical protein